MPNYDYKCSQCGHESVINHGMHDDPPTRCTQCENGTIKKQFSKPNVTFKGSGFYSVDSRPAFIKGK